MNLDFDLESQRTAQGGYAAQPFDWHGLRARLAASHAARIVLEPAPRAATPVDGGSFDRGSARALSRYAVGYGQQLEAVNPIALADGNSGCDKHAGVTISVADD